MRLPTLSLSSYEEARLYLSTVIGRQRDLPEVIALRDLVERHQERGDGDMEEIQRLLADARAACRAQARRIR